MAHLYPVPMSLSFPQQFSRLTSNFSQWVYVIFTRTANIVGELVTQVERLQQTSGWIEQNLSLT